MIIIIYILNNHRLCNTICPFVLESKTFLRYMTILIGVYGIGVFEQKKEYDVM